jgi:hypothetical protein
MLPQAPTLTATRPDIAHAVGVLCRFMSKLGPAHWKAAEHLFRYLRDSVDHRLTYAPDPSSLQLFTTYSDADHRGNPDNGRSTSAYIVKMGTGAVFWMSRLHSIVALSTTEAEFIPAVSAGQEIVWMRLFLGELGCSFDTPAPACGQPVSHLGRAQPRAPWAHEAPGLALLLVARHGELRRDCLALHMATDLPTKALARVRGVSALPQLGLTAP